MELPLQPERGGEGAVYTVSSPVNLSTLAPGNSPTALVTLHHVSRIAAQAAAQVVAPVPPAPASGGTPSHGTNAAASRNRTAPPFPHTFSRISNLYWFMRLDAQRLLSVLRLPARLTLDEAGYLLGFHPEGISFLVSAKILEPLGDPPEGAPLWFAAAQIMQLRTDQKWLSKATKAVRFHIKEKNEKAKAKRGEPNPLVDSGDRVVSGGRCAIH
jgi:hypothetical protein